jgi:hypothetical protein
MTTKVTFNGVVNKQNADRSGELTFAIRTDDQYATAGVTERIIKHFKDNPLVKPAAIAGVVQEAYQIWMEAALKEIADCLDYTSYPRNNAGHPAKIDFYDPDDLARAAVQKGGQLVQKSGATSGVPALYVTLDEMITGSGGAGAEIAISREFSLASEQQPGYQARPGKKPVEEQMKDLAQRLGQMKAQYGENIPIVLLEDNIRHAGMLNWVIDRMQENNVFAAGKLAGIATCFCVASEEECRKIVHDGKIVPVAAVVDFAGSLTDVLTPRDLMFDGHVVKLGNDMCRLPSIFMDPVKLFKISPEKADDFRAGIHRINAAFCAELEKKLGVPVPLSWFPAAEAISRVTGCAPETPMTEVICHHQLTRNTLKTKPACSKPQP